MFISRRKYELEIERAYENGRRDSDKDHWREEELRRLYDRLNDLGNRIRKLEGKKEPADAISDGCPFD